MKSNTKLTLTLFGIVVAAGLAAFWWRAPADVPAAGLPTPPVAKPDQATLVASAPFSTTGAAKSAKPLNASRPEPRPAVTRPAQPEPVDQNSQGAQRSAQDSGVRDHLEAESKMLGPQFEHPDGTQGSSVDATTLKPIMKGEGFDRYLDLLAKQGLEEPLAQDLTERYSIIANDAAKSAEGVTVHRIVCGMKMCLGSITAPSREAFAPWFVNFMANPSTQTLSFGRYDNQLSDGTFEFRVMFATDPSIKSVSSRSGN